MTRKTVQPLIVGAVLIAIFVALRLILPGLLSPEVGQAAAFFTVLVANRVLDEGVDVPEAKVAVVIGGQGSTRQAKQRLGRVLRRSGKARATLYEVVCENTKEVERSRKRRRSDAYERTLHRRV